MATVLVVDDDATLVTTFVRLLRPTYPATWPFERAADAEAQLEGMSAEERSETLVLMDVSLHPGDVYPDGCAAARVFARRFPEIRTLIMSGHDSRDWLHRCGGRVPWVMKPLKGAELLGIIEAVFWAPPWVPPAERRKGDV